MHKTPHAPPPAGDAPPPAYPTRYCYECGRGVSVRAEICPGCGVRLAAPGGSRGSLDAVRIPVLVSAIANLVVALIWTLTCFGVILAVPLAVLCVFEFVLYSNAERTPRHVLARQARTLGIFQVILGLFNTVTLVCGILVLVNVSKLEDR